VLVAHLKVVSGVRVAVGNAAIGRPAVVLMVIVLAATEAHAVIVPAAVGHSKWLRRLNSKS
jgi:hypothetical protein